MIDPPAMQLTDRIHLVGSGWLGFGISHPSDCHVYLIDGGSDAVLIDAGCGLATDTLAQRLSDTRPAGTVSRLLLTHAHPDHAAGAADLAQHLEAEVWAAEPAASTVETGDDDASGLRAARGAGTYPDNTTMRPIPVSRLNEGSARVGDLDIEAIPTSGHASGHCAFFLVENRRRILISGDLLFARGRIAVLATPDTDVTALTSSIRRVAELHPDVLLPGHAEVVLGNADAHIQVALGALDAGALPRSLLP